MKTKKGIKTLLISLIGFAMAMSLFACGPGEENNDDNWWKTEGELTKDENGEVVFNNVSIKLETVVAGDDKDAFLNIVSRFNRLYDEKIRVTVTNTGHEVYETNVASKIQNNNNAPDLLMSHQKSHKNFADNKLIQPLNEAIESSGIEIKASDYASGLARYTSLGYENYMFSVPIDGQSLVVFYNKEELAKTGESLPTNRVELLEVCKAYKNATGNVAIGWETGADYFANYIYASAVMQNGVKLYDPSTFKVDWYNNEDNRSAYKNANKAFRELFDAGYANFGEASSAALNSFIEGKRLFYFTEPWTMEDLVKKYSIKKNVTDTELFNNNLGGASISGWFAMNDNPSKNAIFGDSHFFAMSKTVTDINKKAAILEFIKWFTSNEEAGIQWAKAGHVSVSNIIANSDKYKRDPYVSNLILKFYPNINNFTCVGVTPYYDAVISNLKGLFADLVDKNDRTDAQEDTAIKNRQDAVNNSIDFFG